MKCTIISPDIVALFFGDMGLEVGFSLCVEPCLRGLPLRLFSRGSKDRERNGVHLGIGGKQKQKSYTPIILCCEYAQVLLSIKLKKDSV